MCSSPSTNTQPTSSKTLQNCEICELVGHGTHFGVFTCRACAAFFRRAHLSVTSKLRKCRNSNNNCKPMKNGNWLCKKCRFEKCIKLGMTAENIQLNRDALKTFKTFSKTKNVESYSYIKLNLPLTVELVTGAPHLVTFVRQTGRNRDLPHVDISKLVQKAIATVLNPNMTLAPSITNNLKQLTLGLKDFRSDQKENFLEIKQILSLDDYKNEFERSMCATANWLSYSDRIRCYDNDLKITLLRSIWWVWGRLEQISMTARLRVEQKCGRTQFVYASGSKLDYNQMIADISCWSSYSFHEMKYFFVPTEIFYEAVVCEMIQVQPDDVELTFLMCNICFHLTGEKFRGDIQEEMERLQDILSNDLHQYYMENKKRMYLLRLKHLMRIQETFLKLMKARQEKYEIGTLFKLFNRSLSNPEFFCCSP